jgi:TonB family protein
VSAKLAWAGLLLCAACGRSGDVPPGAEMPVVINSESPFQYPADLFDQGVEGEVRLRLFVDPQGRVVPESTKVASSSGTPGLDSTALRGAADLRFAPGRRGGQPVGMAFYLPVVFRRFATPVPAPAP